MGLLRADEITPDAVLAPADVTSWLLVDDEVVVVHEPTRRAHVLNGSGSLVWQCLDGHASLAEIAADIGLSFEQPVDVVSEQMTALARNLGVLGLLHDVMSSLGALPVHVVTDHEAAGEPREDVAEPYIAVAPDN